jgi:transposase
MTALNNYTLAGVWKLLRRCDLHYKRGRIHVHSPDPDYDTKLAYIAAARAQVEQHLPTMALVYLDELTYYRRPSLAQAYAPAGAHAALVETGYSSNRHRRIAAALDVHSGRLFAWQRSAFDVATFLRFLRALANTYAHAQRVFVVLDNWSVHFDPRISLALQNTNLMLLRLPTYAPWTNPVEKVWLRLKQELLHHHSFADDWPALQAAVQRWLDQWTAPSPDLLHFVGLSPY